MFENEGAHDSNLDIEIDGLTVGLHPERDPDAVFVSIGEASGQITSSSWLGDVVAVVSSDFDDHTSAAETLAKACKVELDEDAMDDLTVALQALRGRGDATATIRWHWGAKGINAKTSVSTRELVEAAGLSDLKCGSKVGRRLGVAVARAGVFQALGRQVRFLVGDQ